MLPTLYLHRCTIQGEINLMSVEAQADGLTVHGPLSLRGSTFANEVRMLGTTIQSELSLASAKFNAPGDALSLDNANVGNWAKMTNGLRTTAIRRRIG